jgi:hypothetical protein
MWLLIGDDYFNTDNLAVIRPVDDGDQTAIFTTGASPVDGGFLVDVATDEVFDLVHSARLMEIAQMLPAPDEDDHLQSPPDNERDS